MAAVWEQGDQEAAVIIGQAGDGDGQDRVESRDGHSLRPVSALLTPPSREGEAGRFSSSEF